MSKRFSRKDLKHDEIAEAAFDFGHWIEHNWRVLVGGVAALAVIVIAVAGWFWLAGEKRAESERLLSAALAAYGKAEQSGFLDDDELSSALYAAEEVTAKAPDSDAAQVAHYYRAVTLGHLGRADEAIGALEQLLAGAATVSTQHGMAELLLVNLYIESGRAADAVARLEAVVNATDPALPKDVALLRLGEVRKAMGETDSARAAWRRVLDEFPDSAVTSEARRYLGPDA